MQARLIVVHSFWPFCRLRAWPTFNTSPIQLVSWWEHVSVLDKQWTVPLPSWIEITAPSYFTVHLYIVLVSYFLHHRELTAFAMRGATAREVGVIFPKTYTRIAHTLHAERGQAGDAHLRIVMSDSARDSLFCNYTTVYFFSARPAGFGSVPSCGWDLETNLGLGISSLGTERRYGEAVIERFSVGSVAALWRSRGGTRGLSVWSVWRERCKNGKYYVYGQILYSYHRFFTPEAQTAGVVPELYHNNAQV